MSASMPPGRVVNFCNRGVHTMVGKLESYLAPFCQPFLERVPVPVFDHLWDSGTATVIQPDTGSRYRGEGLRFERAVNLNR